MSDLKRILASKGGCAVEMQRLWPWEQRGNLSVRLANPLELGCDGKRILDIAVGCLPFAADPNPDVSSLTSDVVQHVLFCIDPTCTQDAPVQHSPMCHLLFDMHNAVPCSCHMDASNLAIHSSLLLPQRVPLSLSACSEQQHCLFMGSVDPALNLNRCKEAWTCCKADSPGASTSSWLEMHQGANTQHAVWPDHVRFELI